MLSFFGVAGVYFIAEAEFVGVSQILVYVGAISTLITFAIMLTRGMMFGATSPRNRQSGTAAIITVLAFVVLAALMQAVPWPQVGEAITDGEAVIARIGSMFVNEYFVAFELAGSAAAGGVGRRHRSGTRPQAVVTSSTGSTTVGSRD